MILFKVLALRVDFICSTCVEDMVRWGVWLGRYIC